MGPRIRLATLLIAAAAALAATGARAQTQATSTTNGSTSVSEPAAITVTQNLSFTVLPQTLNTGLTITSSAVNGVNANVTLTGAQTTSVSVPATFDVTRVGGTETVTVRTVGVVTNLVAANGATQVVGVANGSVFNNPVNVVGTFDSGVLSFSVGGQVTLANNLAPGEYQGVLTVIAQYN
jgi:hypothetical protein